MKKNWEFKNLFLLRAALLVFFFKFFIPSVEAVENPLFGYTHLLPSPFTLPAGRVIIGTTSGVGVTDFFELDTDLMADFYQIYNGRARLSLLDFPGVAAAVYAGFQHVNLNDLSDSNPSIAINSWMPGGVMGVEVAPFLAVFVGGQLYYSDVQLPNSNLKTSGFVQGAQFESDVSWAYNPHENRMGNILSAGFTYNATYKFYGLGLSHHWKKFHLGIHYYPNASQPKVLPILTGGAVIDV